MHESVVQTDRQAGAFRFDVCRLDDVSADRDMKKVWIMVGLQYACFLAGLFCFALNVILIWSGS